MDRRSVWGQVLLVAAIACGSSVDTTESTGATSASSDVSVAASSTASSAVSTGSGGAGGTGGAGGSTLQPCTTLWSERFGGTGTDSAGWPRLLANGNLMISGLFQDTIDFGSGPMVAGGNLDMYLAELDGSANATWSTSYASTGGSEYVGAFSIDQDPNGNLFVGGLFTGTIDLGGGPLVSTVTGQTEYDLFLAKFDATGNHIWSKRLGAPGGDCVPLGCQNSVTALSTGDVVVGISTAGTVDFGAGPLSTAGSSDIFLARFDAAGNLVWTQHFGSSGGEVAMLQGGAGDELWLTGSFEGSFDLGGVPVSSTGARDGFVAKLDTTGAASWVRTMAGAGDAWAGTLDSDGTVVTVAGYFGAQVTIGSQTLMGSGLEAFIARFDSAGTPTWAVPLGGTGDQAAYGVMHDGAGHSFVNGTFGGSITLGGEQVSAAGQDDTFVAILDAAGSTVGACTFGTPGFELVIGFQRALDGMLFVGGFTGSIDFGAGLLTSAGNLDIVVGKLAPFSN